MTWIDDLVNGFNQVSVAIQNSGVVDFIGIILAGFISVFIIVLALLAGLKVLKGYKDYVKKTDHLGVFKFGMRDKHFLTGNVNKSKSFLAFDVFERLKKIPEIHAGVLVMEEMWKSGILYAYDMRVKEEFKTELPDKDVVLLSPIEIESPNVSWRDEKGEFSLLGSPTDLFRRFPYNVSCSEFTEFYDLPDIHGNKKRVYILSPYSKVVNEKLIKNERGQVVPDVLRGKQAYINIINLPNKQDLAVAALIMPALNDVHKELDRARQELKNEKEINQKLHVLTADQHSELEGYKGLTKTHPFIGFARPVIPLPPKSYIGIALAGLIAGFAAVKMSTIDYLARIQGLEYAFMVGAAIILIAAIKMYEDKEKQKTQYQFKKSGDEL